MCCPRNSGHKYGLSQPSNYGLSSRVSTASEATIACHPERSEGPMYCARTIQSSRTCPAMLGSLFANFWETIAAGCGKTLVRIIGGLSSRAVKSARMTSHFWRSVLLCDSSPNPLPRLRLQAVALSSPNFPLTSLQPLTLDSKQGLSFSLPEFMRWSAG